MDKEKVQGNLDDIKDSVEEIEEEVKDVKPKKVSTRGDPVVRFY